MSVVAPYAAATKYLQTLCRFAYYNYYCCYIAVVVPRKGISFAFVLKSFSFSLQEADTRVLFPPFCFIHVLLLEARKFMSSVLVSMSLPPEDEG